MTSLISYSRTIGAAALLGAADLYFNQGRIVSVAVLGALGGLVLKGCARMTSLVCQRGAPIRDMLNPAINQKGVWKAIERFQKAFPKEYQSVVESEKLFEKEAIVRFFTQRLTKGCCAGTADALFSKILTKQSDTLQESERLLKSEDIFYQQMLVDLLQEDIGKGSPRHLEKLCTGIHYGFFRDSASFPVEAALATYQRVLENAVLQFPESEDFIGVIHLPNHVFSIQYGPRGYYLQDVMDPAAEVLKFPDRASFFQDLRTFAMYDAEVVLSLKVKEEMQEAYPERVREEVSKRMKSYRATFSIHPL